MDKPPGLALVDLLAQVADIHIHHIGTALIAVVPDMPGDFFPGKHHALVADKVFQHRKLLAGQGDLPAAPAHLAGSAVHHQVVQHKAVPCGGRPPAHQSPHPGHQLFQGKGLDQVIVRPCVQALNPVLHCVSGGEQEHRRPVPLAPQSSQNFQPAAAGQHDIQKNPVVLGAGQAVLGIQAIQAGIHRVMLQFQPAHQQFVQVFFVLYHQQAHEKFPLRSFS